MIDAEKQEYASWEQVYSSYSPQDLPWFSSEAHPSLLKALEFIKAKGGRALEIGCGFGQNARYLSSIGYETTAIDISSTAIEIAARMTPVNNPVKYLCGDFLKENILGSFDLVVDFLHFHDVHPHHRSVYHDKIQALLADKSSLIISFLSANSSRLEPEFSRLSRYFNGIVTHSSASCVVDLFHKTTLPVYQDCFLVNTKDFSSSAELIVLSKRGANDFRK